jgi:hypothetical protein
MYRNHDDRFPWEDENGDEHGTGGLFSNPPDSCRACGGALLPENRRMADCCPCNSQRGVNHGLVPKNTCTCDVCDPAQTGATRISEAIALGNVTIEASPEAVAGVVTAAQGKRDFDFTVTAARITAFYPTCVVIAWETVSAGFGELTFYYAPKCAEVEFTEPREGEVKVDAEAMSPRFVKEVLAKLVDTLMPEEP